MAIYWIVFCCIALLALHYPHSNRPYIRVFGHRTHLFDYVSLFLIALVAFRFRVGGDWDSYIRINDRSAGKSLDWILHTDIGYSFVDWLGANFFGGVFFPNFVCALVFTLGLRRFCLALPNPFLGMVIALPYLVWVIAMGYTRQAAAIGIFLFIITELQSNQTKKYVLGNILAMLFHKTAVILVPLGLLLQRTKVSLATWLALFSFLFVLAFYSLFADNLWSLSSYFTGYYQSSGAQVRLLITGFSGLFFLLFARYFSLTVVQMRFWKVFSFMGLILSILVFVLPFSTLLDRLGLYWFPLQIFVLCQLPYIFSAKKGDSRRLMIVSVVLWSSAVQWIWLFLSNSAFCWLPYRFYPWEFLWGDTLGASC